MDDTQLEPGSDSKYEQLHISSRKTPLWATPSVKEITRVNAKTATWDARQAIATRMNSYL